MSDLLEVLHVVGAVFIVGPMVILPMFALRAIRAGDGTQVRLLAGSALGFGIATIVVAALGFGVMAMAEMRIQGVVSAHPRSASAIAVATACAVHLGVVVPALFGAAGDRGAGSFGYALIATTSGFVAVLMVIVVVLMVVRPG